MHVILEIFELLKTNQQDRSSDAPVGHPVQRHILPHGRLEALRMEVIVGFESRLFSRSRTFHVHSVAPT